MGKFAEALFAKKTVSVWGIGYLGYTTILRLQSKGFYVNCFSFDQAVFDDIQTGKYPYEYMRQAWSLNNDMPRIDIEKVNFCKDVKGMFDSNVHVIALPAFGGNYSKPEAYSKIADIFAEFSAKLSDSLVLFQSAEKAGTVDNYFIKPLKKRGVKCYFASAFRGDWSVEEFLSEEKIRILAANDKGSLDTAKEFFGILGVCFKGLGSIKEAEIYENAKSCLQYGVEAFFTQLSLAYPDINTNEVSAMIVKNIDLPTKRNGLNLLNHKNILQIEHMLAGQSGDYLSIIKETQTANMSVILFYADILKQKRVSSVTIMGLSAEGAKKDVRASAAILLAEYLNNMGMSVFIHDPYFSKEEIADILPFAKLNDMGGGVDFTESYVLMSQNQEYNYLTQEKINKNGLYDAKIIIDGVGALKYFSFSPKTIYHEVGDGTLKALIK